MNNMETRCIMINKIPFSGCVAWFFWYVPNAIITEFVCANVLRDVCVRVCPSCEAGMMKASSHKQKMKAQIVNEAIKRTDEGSLVIDTTKIPQFEDLHRDSHRS